MVRQGKDIGVRIRAKRGQHSISQVDLAKQVEVSQSAINQYEKGVKTPSVPVLRKIAIALDVSVDYLLGSSVENEIFINQEVISTFQDYKDLSKENKDTVADLIKILKKRSDKKK